MANPRAKNNEPGETNQAAAAHLLLQTRTRVLNGGDVDKTFGRWYPGSKAPHFFMLSIYGSLIQDLINCP
jgi:hypothetical protein